MMITFAYKLGILHIQQTLEELKSRKKQKKRKPTEIKCE